MCILVFSVNPSAKPEEFYLVLVNVRDEVYNRPTKRAEFWMKHPDVIAGMDIEPGKEGGTWLAMNKSGKIGSLLNILQPDNEILPDKKGRGFLAVDYVINGKDCVNYLNDISSEKDEYNGFLLVTLEFSSMKNPKLAYFTNASTSPPVNLEPGTYGFGNSITPDTPWPKVNRAKMLFSNIINEHPSTSSKDALVEALFSLLQDRTRNNIDENMKKQGRTKSPQFLEKLSSIFVCVPESNYGSRCHTVILIDGAGNVDYHERSRDEKLPADGNDEWLPIHYSFKIGS